MPSLPREIAKFMETYGVDSDEVWPVPGGKAYAVKHKALERIATEQGITFDRPSVVACDLPSKSMIICTFGKLGEKTEWSFGEASPANCKNAYFAAMCEKRSRDRVILKLLAAHGDIFSEEESDDFKRQNPHVTRPSDVFAPVEYDQHGGVIDNIQAPDPEAVQKLRVADQKPIFAAMQKEIQATGSIDALEAWAANNRNRLGMLKSDYQEFLRGVYAEHRDAIRQQDDQDNDRLERMSVRG